MPNRDSTISSSLKISVVVDNPKPTPNLMVSSRGLAFLPVIAVPILFIVFLFLKKRTVKKK